MSKSLIFTLKSLFLILLLTACGGGGGGSGSSGEVTKQTITGVAVDATGVPFAKNTEVLAVDANGNAARGRVVNDTGDYEVTLISVASSGKKSKGLGGNIILRVGDTSSTGSLTIVIPSSDGKSAIKVNVNLIVSEASKQFLENLDLNNLFTQVQTALNNAADGKAAALSEEDQQNLSSNLSLLTDEEIQSSVNQILVALFGDSGPEIDFLTGSFTTDTRNQLGEAFTAVKIKTYLITTSAGSNGTISENAIVDFNNSATIVITPKTGYEIDTLLVDNTAVAATNSYVFPNVIADHTIAVTFKLKKYNITTTTDTNGTITASSVVDHGTDVTITMTPNANYEIDVLIVDGEIVTSNSSVTFEDVDSDHTVDVTYKLVSYLISTKAGANGTITESLMASHGSNVTIDITPNTNFAVDVLKVDNVVDATSPPNVTFTNVTAPHTVDVTFKATAYTITTSSDSNGTITASSVELPGNTVTITMTPNAGFLIDELTVDGTVVTSSSTYTFPNISSNHTISVTYKAGHTITTSAGSNGSISASTVVATGTDATVTITPNTGYMVDVLTVDSVAVTSAKAYTFTNVTADHTISVTFKPSKVITATSDANGTISPEGALEVAVGSSQTYTITPKTGYTIDTLTVDGSSVAVASTYTFPNVTTDHTISVTFKIITYTITTSAGANGSITASSVVNYGSTVSISITPSATYVVSSLTVDGVSKTPSTSYTFTNVTADHTISAAFAIGFNITATAGSNGTISPIGTVGVVSGANQTFDFFPNTGYDLDVLTVNGDPGATAPSYTFTNVTSAQTIDITFKIKQYFIATSAGPNGIITASATADHFSNVVITMTPDPGYIIDQLLVDGNPVTPAVYSYTFSNLSAAHTVAVTYIAGYQIAATAGAHGSISPVGVVDVLSGANKMFTITPATGYQLDTLTINSSPGSYDSFTDPDYFYTFVAVSAAQTIDATFKLKEFTVSSNNYNEEGGIVFGADQINQYGTDVTILVMPYPGYLIDYLYIDSVFISTDDPESVSHTFKNITEDHTVDVWFKKDTRFDKNNLLTLGSPASTTDFTTRTDFMGIAAGFNHSVALKKDGTVLAWGQNSNGETITNELSDIKAISAGFQRTVALNNDGKIIEFGNVYSSAPGWLDDYSVSAIAAGYYHTLALLDGEVIAWGYDANDETNVPVAAQSDVKAIAAGEYFSLALKTNGSIVAWGNDEDGIVSDVPALTNVTAIAAGVYHALALKSNGTVVAWGYDSGNNELDTGSLTNVVAIAAGYQISVALKDDGTVVVLGNVENPCVYIPEGLDDVVAISATSEHIMALKSDGSIVSWGDSGFIPASNNGLIANTFVPPFDKTKVPTLKVKAVTSGEKFTVALLDDGTVRASGNNDSGNLNIPANLKNVISISSGANHTLALKADGKVSAWGDDNYSKATIPSNVSASLVKAISAGGNHNLCLLCDGTVLAWGRNSFGQTIVPNGLNNVMAIAAGQNHSVALKSDGTVVAWGNNNFGQSNVPSNLTGVIAIAAGNDHTVALKSNGSLVMWGSNNRGQTTLPNSLINISSNNANNIASVEISVSSSVIAIAAGGDHTVAQTITGKVVAWGSNDYGETDVPELLPPSGSIAAGYNCTHILFCGGVKSIAAYWDWNPAILKTDGSAVHYFDNTGLVSYVKNIYGSWYDILGIHSGGGVTSNDSYIDSGAYYGVRTLAAGYYHVLTVKDNGTIFGWGTNDDGQSTSSETNVIAVSASFNSSLALRSNGSLVAWGQNINGQLAIPAGLDNVKAISCGSAHTLALKGDGTVSVWGDQSPAPAGLDNVVAIAAGSFHSLALKADGTVVAWGSFSQGQTDVPPDLTGVVAIAAGAYFSMALKQDGSVIIWGITTIP